jgi:hypothetical protein
MALSVCQESHVSRFFGERAHSRLATNRTNDPWRCRSLVVRTRAVSARSRLMDVPTNSQSVPPTQRRNLWRYSLRWLLTLVVVGCLAAAWFGEKRRREAAEQENRKLRVALGIVDEDPGFLSISDPSKVHVRSIFFPHDELHWRWQIYTPGHCVRPRYEPGEHGTTSHDSSTVAAVAPNSK